MIKKILILFTLSFFSYSQNDVIGEYLIVKNDSTSFYTFTKKGAYFSKLNGSGRIIYDYVPYKNPIPKSLDRISLNSLSATKSSKGIYFLYPGGGIVYKYLDGSIVRIDDSFAHRNQFSGFFFSYNQELYLLGGYGYWATKSYLTKFNFQSGSWDRIETYGSPPKHGINQGSFIKDGNSVFAFDFFSKKNAGAVNEKNRSLFELNLSTMNWNKKGMLLEFSEKGIEEKIMAAKIPKGDGLIVKYQSDDFFKIFTPRNNLVSTYKLEDKIPKFGNNAISIGSTVVFGSNSADNTTKKIVTIDLGKLSVDKKQQMVMDQNQMFKRYLVFVFIFLVLLTVSLFTYFKNYVTIFYVSNNAIRNEKGTLLLTKDEISVLNILINKKETENSVLLNLFDDKTKSAESIIKIKNKIIKDFNFKFFSFFGKELILKKVSKRDSRQVVYSIENRTKLLYEEMP